LRTHLLKGAAAAADAKPEASSSPSAPSTYQKWRGDKDRVLEQRARDVVALFCTWCNRDVAAVRRRDLGDAAVTILAISLRDHEASAACGGPYEVLSYQHKGPMQRRPLEAAPPGERRELGEWRRIVREILEPLQRTP
jgi:hypothetical protein